MVIFVALLLVALPLVLVWRADRRVLVRWLPLLAKWGGGLAASAVVVYLLFLWDRAWLNLLWLALMTAVGALLTARRSAFVMPLTAGLFAAVLSVGLLVALVAGAGRSCLSARWVVPLGAWLVGTVAPVCRRGIRSYCNDRHTHRDLYEYQVGNGASHRHALQPFVHKAVLQGLTPLLSSYAAIGMVALPSVLCGMLLGGADALRAVVLTLLLMGSVVSASMVSIIVGIWVAENGKKGDTEA